MKLHPCSLATLRASAAALLLATIAGCGGGIDPILGTPPVGSRPTVSSTVPMSSTPAVSGVDTHTILQASFSGPMLPSSINTTSFSVACPATEPIAASVSVDATARIASLTPTVALPPSTTSVATVAATVQDAAGVAMDSAYSWSFVTGLATALDVTRPTVSLITPAIGALAAPTNTRVSVSFSEPMDAATVTTTSFTLRDTTLDSVVAGSLGYAAASRTAVFTPTAPAALVSGHAYAATLAASITDLAGNGLAGNTAVVPAAGNHVWAFSVGASADATPPTVTAISPADGSTGVCLTKTVSATFGEPMNPASFTSANFTVTDNGVSQPGSVSYNADTQVATFTATAAAGFAASRSYVVTIASGGAGVKDLADNALAADRSFGFSTGTQACLAPVNLGAAASFGAFGGAAGVTNQGINTVVGGNLGSTAACTLITGLHDATQVYTETPLNIGAVSGSIQCGPPAPGTTASLALATQARADALTAYNALAAMPPGSDPGAGQLGGLVLAAGVYTAAGGSFAVTTGNLTLDAQGDANAVWVFQSASALTVGIAATPRTVQVINGGQARNVYWQVGSAARIEDGSTMVGTLIAPAGVTFSTAGQTVQTRLTGRAIGLTASVTLVNTTIVAP